MTKRLVELCTNFQGKIFLTGTRIVAELLGWAKRIYAPEGLEPLELSRKIAEKAPPNARGYSVEREISRNRRTNYIDVRYYALKR